MRAGRALASVLVAACCMLFVVGGPVGLLALAPARPSRWTAHTLLAPAKGCASHAAARRHRHRAHGAGGSRKRSLHPANGADSASCAAPSAKAPSVQGSTGASGVTGPAATGSPGAPAGSGETVSGSSPGEGSGTQEEPGAAPHVQVTAVEYSFTLSRTSVPAGKVVFQFVNNGMDEHNMQVLPGEGPLAGSFADTPSKGIASQAIMLKPGRYMLFCSLPEHEAKGMKATLTVN
ncbi:MAG TPA: plastocyanin/azurin family copper-binding protein [Solirubrobacteraceae bacterium]|jgi:plastocyanin|nr:plastocyanin/azurin family copper-binding protein [Solirubrobacteraceae bacterium]